MYHKIVNFTAFRKKNHYASINLNVPKDLHICVHSPLFWTLDPALWTLNQEINIKV